MAEMNGTAYMPGCGAGLFDPWQSMFFATESMRREFSFSAQSIRDHIDSNRNSADRQFSDIGIQAEKTAAATNLAIEKTAAASQLLATQNTSAILAQMAECCCEIKEKIAADGQQTRDLINSIEQDRLRTLNSDLKAQLLALQSCCRPNGNGNGN